MFTTAAIQALVLMKIVLDAMPILLGFLLLVLGQAGAVAHNKVFSSSFGVPCVNASYDYLSGFLRRPLPASFVSSI